jgi:hypothetical protein
VLSFSLVSSSSLVSFLFSIERAAEDLLLLCLSNAICVSIMRAKKVDLGRGRVALDSYKISAMELGNLPTGTYASLGSDMVPDLSCSVSFLHSVDLVLK